MTSSGETFGAIIIGAWVAGLYQLHKLREPSLPVRVFEDGSGVDGSWCRNYYPGARFNLERSTYALSSLP